MKTFEQKLSQYAELVIKVGLNLQKGQRLFITTPLEAAPFIREVVKNAYENGCKQVFVDWKDTLSTRIHLSQASEEVLSNSLPPWEVDKHNSMIDHHDCYLIVKGIDPNAFEGIDPQRIMLHQKNTNEQLQSFTALRLRGDMHWAIVCAPTPEWAKSVFPELNEKEAVEALWEAIFKAVRVDQDDPVAAWKEHSQTLMDKMNYLNEQRFKTLHYKSAGTNVSIDLHPDHHWIGGGHQSTFGTFYIPNLPTEEVFTTPLKTGVNGTVSSTKPLSALGNMIENFTLQFKEGKVVDFSAEKGYDTLKQLLSIDEGMLYLGEVALVPYDSPISQSGIVFNITVYDENASCHLALGNAITSTVKNSGSLSNDELIAQGVNQSRGHTDFMIGSADLDIDGETEDGRRIPLFRDGNWAV